MGKETALTAIDLFHADLVRRGIRVAELVLFGSYAKGTQHEWSDIDLVVVSPDFAGKGLWDRIAMVSPAMLAAHAPIEPIILTPEEWADQDRLICQIVRQDSEVVYSADVN